MFVTAIDEYSDEDCDPPWQPKRTAEQIEKIAKAKARLEAMQAKAVVG